MLYVAHDPGVVIVADGVVTSAANVKYCTPVMSAENSRLDPVSEPLYMAYPVEKSVLVVFTNREIAPDEAGNFVHKLEPLLGTENLPVLTLHTSCTLNTLFNTCFPPVAVHVNAPLLSQNVRYDLSAPNAPVFNTFVLTICHSHTVTNQPEFTDLDCF